jgi:hypothetical protein
MEKVGRPGTAPRAAISATAPQLASRRSPLLQRLFLMGVLILVTAFVYGSAIAQNSSFSEEKTPFATAAEQAKIHSRHQPESRDDGVPLLFLALLGLGAVALSQTRPTPAKPSPTGSFCAGKNVSGGQELPETKEAPSALASN